MSKHDCKTISSNIPDFVDGKLSADAVSELQDHLERCEHCAEEEATIRQFMQSQLSELRDDKQDIDWNRFSMQLNDEIDRRRASKKTAVFLSPAVLLPVAAAFLVLLAFWVFTGPMTEDSALPQPAYAVTLDRQELNELTTEEMRSLPLEEVTVSFEENSTITVVGPSSELVIIENDALTSEVQSALVESIGFANLVEASFDYFSTQEVLNAMDDDDLALLASTLEIEYIDIQ